MADVNFIKHAMNLLNFEINADDGPGSYRDGWKANISMCIWDSINSTPINIGTEDDPQWVGQPLDPTKMEDCNEIADRFLRMAFPKDED